MLRKIAKIFAWLIGGAIGLVVLFYLVLLVINWRDVPPSAEALRFTQMYANRPQVPDARNAYVYLVGMSVERKMDPMSAGLAMLEVARSATVTSDFADYQHPEYSQIDFANGRTEEATALVKACSGVSDECLNFLNSDAISDIDLSSLDETLLDRYYAFVEFYMWQDIFPQGMTGPYPAFTPVFDGQTIFLFGIWQKADNRDVATTIKMLEVDARFWRMVSVSSDSLITSMMASHSLKKNLFWSNLVLQRVSRQSSALDILPAWSVPFSDDERLLMRPWAGEMALAERLVKEIPDPDKFRTMLGYEHSFAPPRMASWFAKPLFLSQETLNRNARLRARLIDTFKVPYERLPAVAKRMKESPMQYDDVEMSFPRFLYNPVGKALDRIGQYDESGYMLRVPNLEGGRRALLATIELRYNKIPRDKVAEALAGSAYRNPYTNEPFMWDVATGRVVFEGLGEGKQRRYLFPY